MKKQRLLALSLLLTTAVFGQEKDKKQILETVIIQGNRLEIPFHKTTRDIQVITAKEIEQMPVQSVHELLSYVGGIDIRQRAPFGGQADISIDGGSFEQTLVLLNGIKLINSQTAHNMLNIPVPLDAIDHIEILRGAAARVYGINALTGAVNIVTKKSNSSFLTTHVQLGSSFEPQVKEEGDGIYGGGSFQLTGNYGTEKQSHLFAFGQDVYNGQRYNSAFKATRLFYNGNYEINDKNSIQALAGYVNSRYGANGFYAAPGDKNSEEIVETTLFSLSSTHEFGNLSLTPRISTRYDEDDYRYFKHKLDVARSLHYTNALMLELNGNLTTKVGKFGFGWESRLEEINSSNIGEHKRSNHGAFAEYRRTWFHKLTTSLGVYLNYNTDYGWQAYPGIDVAYRVNTNWKIAASLGSGQRIPSFTDLYLNQAPGNVGNPNIQPESAWEYEASVTYMNAGFSAKTGVFYRNITDFIDWTRPNPNTPYSPVNFSENKIYGIYVRMQQEFYFNKDQKFGYQLSYNYLDPQPLANKNNQSKYILQALKHQFIAGIHYHYKDVSIQLKNRYIKRMLNDPYNVLDMRINYELKDFLIYTNISNILDAQYKEVGAIPMPSRWFSLGLKYTWN